MINMNLWKKCLLLGFLSGTVLTIPPAFANPYYYTPNYGNNNKAIKHACRDQVREQIWSDHRYIQKVEFTRGSYRFWNASDAKSGMAGKGRFLNRKQRWKEFEFTCIYSQPQDRVISVNYRKVSSGSNGNSGWNQPGSGNSGRHACKLEIDRKVLRNHESASKIRWDERRVHQWRESNSKTGYRGTGSFVGGRGHTRYYEFQCVYDHRRDDVSSARVDIRDR